MNKTVLLLETEFLRLQLLDFSSVSVTQNAIYAMHQLPDSYLSAATDAPRTEISKKCEHQEKFPFPLCVYVEFLFFYSTKENHSKTYYLYIIS